MIFFLLVLVVRICVELLELGSSYLALALAIFFLTQDATWWLAAVMSFTDFLSYAFLFAAILCWLQDKVVRRFYKNGWNN